jgi:hypothetical protein
MARTKGSINKKNQTHGAQIDDHDNLYSFMGKKTSAYKETDLESYSVSLKEMNLVDLQKHAIEVANIIPSSMNRNTLIEKLEKEFLRKKGMQVARKITPNYTNLKAKDEKDLKDFMSKAAQ